MNKRPAFDFGKAQNRAMNETGKSGPGISSLIRHLISPRRIMPGEYFMYGLDRKPEDEVATFQGSLSYRRLNARFCDSRWRLVVEDKLLSHSLLAAFGLPIPIIRAISGSPRRFPQSRICNNEAELLDFIEHHDGTLFAKPVYGLQSRGTGLIDRSPKGWPHLLLDERREVEAEKLAHAIFAQEGGYMFQDRIRQQDSVRQLVGDAVSTVRFMLTFDDGEVRPQRVVWKICASGNKADNFWRDGNLLGLVDLDSGRLERVVTQTDIAVETVSHHPDTGAAFEGFQLPDWAEVRKIAVAAAPLFPGIRVQSYDIALTPDGPMIVEINDLGDFAILQLGQERGIWNDHMQQLSEKDQTEARRRYDIRELEERIAELA
jgi:hypothetical protein